MANDNNLFLNKSNLINFIESVKNYPCLYNTQFANKYNNKKAWIEIAKKYNSTVDECRYKWRKLRVSYMRSLNRRQSSDNITREYYLTNYLRFLRPFIKIKQHSDKINTQNDINYSDVEIIDDINDIKNVIKKEECVKMTNKPNKMLLLSLLPDLENYTESEMRYFVKKIIKICDNVERKRFLNK
ncbi:similar to CG3838 gene product [Betaentomopoxvirus amoorei]|uniref:AMV266 n=1 Tax=Amsacta moorei entomopoxvirus TaxID=28321 RepID=Q9EME0_AMEPV|nr:similar to CG3838 gene product [Amsacta moorei entomopoxvirus]AAG02972.1 AMV266 [Amsacta moorei entomopoxvirus]